MYQLHESCIKNEINNLIIQKINNNSGLHTYILNKNFIKPKHQITDNDVVEMIEKDMDISTNLNPLEELIKKEVPSRSKKKYPQKIKNTELINKEVLGNTTVLVGNSTALVGNSTVPLVGNTSPLQLTQQILLDELEKDKILFEFHKDRYKLLTLSLSIKDHKEIRELLYKYCTYIPGYSNQCLLSQMVTKKNIDSFADTIQEKIDTRASEIIQEIINKKVTLKDLDFLQFFMEDDTEIKTLFDKYKSFFKEGTLFYSSFNSKIITQIKDLQKQISIRIGQLIKQFVIGINDSTFYYKVDN